MKVELLPLLKFQRGGSAVSEMPADSNQAEQKHACLQTSLSFTVHHGPSFPCGFSRLNLLIQEGELMLICLNSSFFTASQTSTSFSSSLGANKKMESRNEWAGRGKWIMRLSRSIHLIQQHVFTTCHFFSTLLGTGYINFLPAAFKWGGQKQLLREI